MAAIVESPEENSSGASSSSERGTRESSLDWEALASLLAENEPRPLLVFDPSAHILLSNSAMDELLGRGRGELLGRAWSDICLLQAGASEDGLLSGVLRGAIRKLACESLAAHGQRLRLTFELNRLGQGNSAGVLAVVTSVTHLQSPWPSEPEAPRRYEIRSSLQDFGIIRAAYARGTSLPALEGQRCYQILHQRNSPCPSCPVLAGSQEGWPRTAVFRCAEESEHFQIVTAEPLDAEHVRLTVQLFPDSVFRKLVHAKIKALAVDASLSERECRVLDQLVAGLELQEIAHLLGISVRTVKFHQANILRKLGVDSRSALMRRVV